jgi:hypothetical protein
MKWWVGRLVGRLFGWPDHDPSPTIIHHPSCWIHDHLDRPPSVFIRDRPSSITIFTNGHPSSVIFDQSVGGICWMNGWLVGWLGGWLFGWSITIRHLPSFITHRAGSTITRDRPPSVFIRDRPSSITTSSPTVIHHP